MKPDWIEAGGEYQVPFIAAAARVIKGADVACPKCAAPHLRHYFHRIDRRAETGTAWVWCDNCRTHTHLPRVRPQGLGQRDPLADVNADAFGALELDAALPFLDRLNDLWESGRLAPPEGPV